MKVQGLIVEEKNKELQALNPTLIDFKRRLEQFSNLYELNIGTFNKMYEEEIP
jgi:hypothetical protein